jgi:hypothetical protein
VLQMRRLGFEVVQMRIYPQSTVWSM